MTRSLSNHQLQRNPYLSIDALLRRLSIQVSQSTVENTVREHPDFPSLLSLSDALNEWNVKNAAFKLQNAQQLDEIPTPFIAHSNKKNGQYLLVESISQEAVTSFEPASNQRLIENKNDFSKHWSGVILIAEKTKESGETEYYVNKRKKNIAMGQNAACWLSALVMTVVIIMPVMSRIADIGLVISWIMMSVTGLLLSISLSTKQLGYVNSITDKLCDTIDKAGCDNLLNSPGAKLLGIISWADIGLVYFAGGTVLSFIALYNPMIWQLLKVLSLLALPYSIYSIYYQWRIARQWCTLCLCVQAILLSESIISVLSLDFLANSAHTYILFVCTYTTIALIWMKLKKLVQNNLKAEGLRIKLARFKNDPAIFESLLYKQTKAPGWLPEVIIDLGNSEAKHTITMVVNPYCAPCAAAHEELKQLLSKNLHFKAELIFMSCDGPNGKSTRVLELLTSFKSKNSMIEALDSWYKQSNKNYDSWKASFANLNLERTNSLISEQHCQWSDEAKITATPTIFLNGYRLPKLYQLNDLKWMADLRHPYQDMAVLNK